MPRPTPCPACGAAVEASLPASVCAQVVPGARERARLDRLLAVACKGCGELARLEPEMLLWTDLERGEYVVVVPIARMAQAAVLEPRVIGGFRTRFLSGAQDVWADPERVAVRLVFGGEGLAEKIVAWDAGLDDRVVEMLEHALATSDPARRHGLEVGALVEVTEAGDLVFAAVGREELLVVGRAAYDALASRRDWLAEDFPELFRGAWVDARRYPLA